MKFLSIILATTVLVAAQLVAMPSYAGSDEKLITVYKDPSCGCCKAWATALNKAGFSIKSIDVDDLDAVKKQVGVGEEFQACHTALLGGYILEGHVPLQAIEKLQSERPNIRGIAVPGMPSGSLGMGYDPTARYDVLALPALPGEKPTTYYSAGR